MLAGEQCLSVLSPDENIIMVAPPKPGIGSSSVNEALSGVSSGGSSATAGGGGGDGGYFNIGTASGGAGSSHHHHLIGGNCAGRGVYIQLTNFRCIVKFFGEEQHTSAVSLPFSAIQEVTAETASGSKINVCSALFSRLSSSSSSSSVWKFFSPSSSATTSTTAQQQQQQPAYFMPVNPASPSSNIAIAVTPPTTPTSRRQRHIGGGEGKLAVKREDNTHNNDSSGSNTPSVVSASNSPATTPRNIDLAPPPVGVYDHVNEHQHHRGSSSSSSQVVPPLPTATSGGDDNQTDGSAASLPPPPPLRDADGGDGAMNATAVFSSGSQDHQSQEEDSNNTNSNKRPGGGGGGCGNDDGMSCESFDVVRRTEVNRCVADQQMRQLLIQQQQQREGVHHNATQLIARMLMAQQQQQQPLSLSPTLALGGDQQQQQQQQQQLLSLVTRQPIVSVHITSLHGWSWRLIDPLAATISEQNLAMSSGKNSSGGDQQSGGGVGGGSEMRGLTKFVNELKYIMTLLAEANELFTTVTCGATAVTSNNTSDNICSSSDAQQQPPVAFSAPGSPQQQQQQQGGLGGFEAPDTAIIPLEDQYGWHIYNTRRDLDRMLNAAANRDSQIRAKARLAARTAASSNKGNIKDGTDDGSNNNNNNTVNDTSMWSNPSADHAPSSSTSSPLSPSSSAVPIPPRPSRDGGETSSVLPSSSSQQKQQQQQQQQQVVVSPFTATAFENSFVTVRIDHGSSRFATYPFEVIVPASVDIGQLLEASHCRQNGRVPVISWLCPHRKVTLSRSSQPLVTGQWNAEADVHLLNSIRRSFLFRQPDGTWGASSSSSGGGATTTTPSSSLPGGAGSSSMQKRTISAAQQQKKMHQHQHQQQPFLVVADCRSRQAATSNMALGGGYETQARYGKDIDTIFLDLPNIHDIVKEFEKLRESSANSQKISLSKEHPLYWAAHQHASPEDDGWQKRRRKLIRAGCSIALLLDRGTSVLVHCTDGWDRTPAVCCIAKIILDSYYRTIRGFCELVEREWMQLGHRFADRNCGPVPSSSSSASAAVHSPQLNTSATAAASPFAAASAQQQQQQQQSSVGGAAPITPTLATTAWSSSQQQQQTTTQFVEPTPDWCRYPDVHDVKPQLCPIFFQFLDAIRELVEMFPSRFEFTPALLSAMLHSSYSGEYGTFLCNTHRQRHHPVHGLAHRSLSFWTEVAKAVDDELFPSSSSSSSGASGAGGAGGAREPPLQQPQQQQHHQSSRLFECHGIQDMPIVNPTHRANLRAVQMQQAELKDGGGFLTNVAVDDGSVLVPVFDVFGSARSVWSSWLTVTPKWNRFADPSIGKNYQITSPTTAASAATEPTTSTSLPNRDDGITTDNNNGNISTVASTLRTFPDAALNFEHHKKTILAPPDQQSSTSTATATAAAAAPPPSGVGGGASSPQASSSSSAFSHLPKASAAQHQFFDPKRSPFLGAAADSGGNTLSSSNADRKTTTTTGEASGADDGGGGGSSSPPPLALQFTGKVSGPPDGQQRQQQQQQQENPFSSGGIEYFPLRERDDDESCFNCKKHFSLFQRRHTCRACCHSFCVDCGNKFCVIPAGMVRDKETRDVVEKKPQTAVRLCDDCYYDMTSPM